MIATHGPCALPSLYGCDGLTRQCQGTPLIPPSAVDLIGIVGATLTTLCWLPQAAKSIREKDTQAISLFGTAAFAAGVACWLIYGFAKGDMPLIGSSSVTLALVMVILALKLRHG
jgi:MtN3 and saliva related transmembrane protein